MGVAAIQFCIAVNVIIVVNVILAIDVLFAVLVLAQIGTAQCVFCDDGCKDDGKGNKAEFCCKSRNSGDDDDDAQAASRTVGIGTITIPCRLLARQS